MMQLFRQKDSPPIQGRDVVRWLTFTSFWGFISYLLACASMLGAQRRQPTQLNTPTAAVGMGVHIGSLMLLGSLGSAAAALISGKSTTKMSEERIAGGELEQSGLLRGLLSGVGSIGFLGLAIVSMAVAEKTTGAAVFSHKTIRWPQAVGTMALSSGMTALAVNRIAGWVARDAKRG
jgi:hypothetical protein